MNTDMLVTVVTGGLGLFLAVALVHGLSVIRYARSPRCRVHQRLNQLRR